MPDTPPNPLVPAPPGGVVLFDGVCNLCNGFVNWLIDHDHHDRLRFASLQSDAGQRLLRERGEDPSRLDSVILVTQDRVYEKSGAVLRMGRALGGIWALGGIAVVVPRFIRDVVYDFVAARRYDWFGKRASCRMPTPELQRRFIEDAPGG